MWSIRQIASVSAGATLTVALWCFGLAGLGDVSAAEPQPQVEEIRHVVLLLDDAPVHIRFRIALGGKSLMSFRQTFVDELVRSLDIDNDGKLTRQESARSPLLRKEERGALFIRTLDTMPDVSREEVMRTVERVAGETVVYRQLDAPSENDQHLFELLDANRSGVIESEEMASAADVLRQHDEDHDHCVDMYEVRQEQNRSGNAESQPPLPRPDTPRATLSDIMRDASEPLLPRRLLRKYDKNSDGKLSAQELGWTESVSSTMDENHDGRLSVTELHHFRETAADLDIAVDIAPEDASNPRLQVLESVSGKVDQRLGLAETLVRGAILTISYHHVDPVNAALANARQRFNQLDADANGYLSRDEVRRDVRMRRGLFDTIDADGDDKIFGEEMESYVRLRSAVDTTSCCVNLYDTGSGFFQSLDRNRDGRISERELRLVKESLEAMQRDDVPGISLEEPTRRFHIEFARASFQLFGPPEESNAELPTLHRVMLAGPIWFQRMDRNNDGDLTWQEFLGHREDFYRLDVDKAELIDPAEAEKAK
jgi:Ca2+-binding EF-hand superfamily protein